MKSARMTDPARWRDLDADDHALEARAAALADAARQAPPVGAQALSRIRAQVLERAAARRRFVDFRRLPIVARAAVGLALVLVCAATADGASILWRRYVRASGRSAPTPIVAAPPRAHRPSHRAAASNADGPNDAPPETLSASVPPVASDEVETSRPLRHVDARLRASVAPAPAPAPAPLAPEPAPLRAVVPTPPIKVTEAGMVAEALSQLRQQGDPRAALLTLDAHDRAFPHGVLETEALRTRLEAVIRLDDRKTALALLDAMPGLSDTPGTDLLLTRAELRAAAGRFREALADFTQILDDERDARVAASERALYGRAVCLGRLAEDDRARADLLAYERQFPNGRFAPEVRRLLSEHAPAEHP